MVSRRAFLGGAVGAPVATTALGGWSHSSDPVRNAALQNNAQRSVSLRRFLTANTEPNDWTAVVQRAADSGERGIYIPGDIDAACEGPITITKAGQTWFSDGWRTGCLRRTTSVEEPFLICDTIGVSFHDLSIIGPGAKRSVRQSGIQGKRGLASKPADLDMEVRGCKISGWHYGISIVGRGLRIDNVLFSLNRYWVDLDFPEQGTYADGKEFHQSPDLGFRAFQFTNIRSHANGVGGVRNVRPRAANIGGVYMAGVLGDIGGSIWIGALNRALIEGINVDLTNRPSFTITSGSDWEISNFRIAGEPTFLTRRNPDSFIKLSGELSNCVISNGTLAYNRQDGIYVDEGSTLDGIEINDIFFIEPCLEGRKYSLIKINGSNHKISIRDLTMKSSRTLRSFVQASSEGNYVQVRGVENFGGLTPVRSE